MLLVTAPVASEPDPRYWSYFKTAPYFPADVISRQVTLSGQRDGVRPCGQKVHPWRGKGQAVYGVWQQITYGDRRTSCFGKGRGLSNNKCFSAIKHGSKNICLLFASCCPSVTWILLTVSLIIYLVRLWVKSKKEALHAF